MILFPSVINRGTRSGMNRKRRNQVGSIEPVSMPIPYRINQVIVKEFALKTLMKLNPAATKNIGVIAAGLGLQAKKVTKEGKRRRNSKESFTKMYKNRKMEDGIGGKMVQADPKITKKSMKENRSQEAKSSTNKGNEENDLTRT